MNDRVGIRGLAIVLGIISCRLFFRVMTQSGSSGWNVLATALVFSLVFGVLFWMFARGCLWLLDE